MDGWLTVSLRRPKHALRGQSVLRAGRKGRGGGLVVHVLLNTWLPRNTFGQKALSERHTHTPAQIVCVCVHACSMHHP